MSNEVTAQPSAGQKILDLIMEECRYWHGRDEARRGGFAILYAAAKEITDKDTGHAELETELRSTAARLHEVATACANAEQERDDLRAERDAALAELAALKGGRDVQLIEALRSADWPGVSIGNKALIQAAIQRLTAPPAQASEWVAEGCATIPVDKLQHLLTDALTAADLVRNGNRSKALSERLSEHYMELSKMLAAAPTPGASDGEGGE